MPLRRTLLVILVICFALAFAGYAAKTSSPQSEPTAMAARQRALHALNRLTFGPRPGEAEQVEKMGVDRWIDQQLHPEKIDDPIVAQVLAPYRTLNMSTAELIRDFPPPPYLKSVAAGKQPMPSDPAERAIYQSAIAMMQLRQQKKTGDAGNAPNSAAQNTPAGSASDEQTATKEDHSTSDAMVPAGETPRQARMYAQLDADKLLTLAPRERYDAVLKMSPEERVYFVRALKGPARLEMLSGLTPEQTETVEAFQNPQFVVAQELQAGKLLREIYSERQLQEVMTDFWMNHFNVFINKGPEKYFIAAYENEVVRPRALGKFKDLLLATAQSPAMLFYLDNWQSVGPDSDIARGIPPRRRMNGQQRRRFAGGFGRRPQRTPPQAAQNQKRATGLNENYAREIMELHTLSVNGGYTQKDVTELAKILTGWTIEKPYQGGRYVFNPRMHEPGDKIFLGKTFHEDGKNEGLKAIDMLAHSPQTAHFISKKLAMRFVSDDPPPALVERMAQTFLRSDGDIREVLGTLFHSPEFWAAGDYRAKVKTPLEFVVSAVRATAANVNNPTPLIQALNRMGEPLYGMQPPTGYSMLASAWVNSDALINRMNFALQLGSGRMPGIQPDEDLLLGAKPPEESKAALSLLEQDLLAGDVSSQTHAVLVKQLNDPQVTRRKLDDPARPPNYGVLAGLILGSPEFQRR